MSLTLRIRTQLGTWRLSNVSASDTMGALRGRIELEHRTDLQGRPLTRDPSGTDRFSDVETVGQLKLENGAMLYAMVDETKSGIHEKSTSARMITKDGNIVAQEHDSMAERKGFRPGMMPLRDMKMQWTLNEFMALDSQFEYKISKQPQAFCTGVTLESQTMQEFHNYMLNFDYQCMRIGYLYGTYQEDNSVNVDFIYEPPQNKTDTAFELLEDPRIDAVEALCGMLGRRRVGWLVAHPTREAGFFLSGAEAIEAAEQQLLAAGGITESPFVTVKCTINTKNEYEADAYQVSKQCMDMAAERVLTLSPNLGACGVNPTFTAVVEGRSSKEIDTSLFLNNVAIKSFDSDVFISQFPRCNRTMAQSSEDLKRQVSKVGQKGWTLLDLVSDFHLLLYLASSGMMSMEDDMPHLCRNILDHTPVSEGHALLIRSLAGID